MGEKGKRCFLLLKECRDVQFACPLISLLNKLRNSPNLIDQYEDYEVDDNFFEKFELETLDISVLLFQTGYLTIKKIKDNIYFLSYPNREVKTSFLQYLLEDFSGKKTSERNKVTSEWKYKILGEIGSKTKIGITKEDEIEIGKKEEKRRMGKMMLDKNYPIEEIILLTGLSEEEINPQREREEKRQAKR